MNATQTTKFTPGPWAICGPYDNGYLASGYLIITGYDVSDRGPSVGVFDGREPLHGYGTGFKEEDARLIAASPMMFDALQQIVSEGECYCADHVAAHGPCGHCVARAAIEKATR